jgi:tetratricopeptide (TPR) repeat protein
VHLTGPLRAAALAAALALLTACAPAPDLARDVPPEVPSRAAVQGVPLIEQQDFYCGPASLAMVMQWSGRDVTQDQIAELAFSPGAEGTYLADMIGAARREGQLAVNVVGFGALLEEVAAGHPVIVFQNLSLPAAPRWHYAVVVGYDLEREQVVLHSGELDRVTMSFDLFGRTWRRGDFWALAVLPPDRLPASADQWSILQAAAALERVARYGAGETAYVTRGAAWPDNWLWWFGLGNARYAQGDLAGARRAFERAAAVDPSVPEVRNNLAQVNRELAAAGG